MAQIAAQPHEASTPDWFAHVEHLVQETKRMGCRGEDGSSVLQLMYEALQTQRTAEQQNPDDPRTDP